MAISLNRDQTFLFTGDSVTDCGRLDDPDRQLGHGYVRVLAGLWADASPTMINTGISGNRVVDLESRLQADVLDHGADVVSILIGVNDMWRRYDKDDPTSVEAYENGYRTVLGKIAGSGASLVLVEPFLLPVRDEQQAWREDLDPKLEAVRRLASEFNAVLVPADVELNKLAPEGGAEALAADGVHPTPLGHVELAHLWHRTVFTTAN